MTAGGARSHGFDPNARVWGPRRMHFVESTSAPDWVSVTPIPLSAADLTTWATRANCGAVVTFCGTVRDNSHDLVDIQALEYETSVAMAERRMLEIVAEARNRWPMLGAVAIHRSEERR